MNLKRPFLIRVVHLPPLPGSPGWKGEMDAVAARAVSDAETYRAGAMDAVIVENFGDIPFFKGAVPDAPLFAGSGPNAKNVKSILEFADGIIVGSSLKAGGDLEAAVDKRRGDEVCQIHREIDDREIQFGLR